MLSHGSVASAALDIGSPRNPPPSSNPFFNNSVPFFPRTPPPAHYEDALRQQERQATQWPKIWEGLLSGTLFEWDWLLWKTVAGKPGHSHPIGLSFASEGPGG